ncbi:MAG: hypothetical protein COV72_02195 [Candidatus Omnitrophica bacterium CG11_big_fil_rev_8_21_14_0_20_42_13]|uniref:Group 1 glycosyl transferase n=1 Tax=Candidatus Ghiorseimicrobium undicola TaxID=1974746 RepID=A0A2H0LZ30_9BACT|nr:MAG: hypothetical protein COV72_02195 [Candidatus Omnitrophica bacterium CG11_big_fil_rev_8_21_14_0_20_42_13]
MRVLFIVPYPTEGPSNRFRVEQYFPELEKEGILYKLRPFYSQDMYRIVHKKGHYFKKILYLAYFTILRFADVLSAGSFDVIFIHREAFPVAGAFFETLFRLFSKRMIYDFDDSIFLKKPAKVNKTIAFSDYVIAGNNFLKNYAAQHNKNVTVIPTCIDTGKYAPKNSASEKDNIIIGWIGTSFTSIYLDMLKDVFRQLSGSYKNIEFRIVGGKLDIAGVPLSCKYWALDSEVNDLQEFDIGIMPLFDDEWSRGKCAFKIIQYMAVGVPAVASRVGMNSEVIEDGRDGFLVSGKNEWVEKLSLLIGNKNLRRDMGIRAREKALRAYSILANKQKFLGVLKDAAAKK